jgi:hypothetical protein
VDGFRKWAFQEQKGADTLNFLREVMFFSWTKFTRINKLERKLELAELTIKEIGRGQYDLVGARLESNGGVAIENIEDHTIRNIVKQLTSYAHLRLESKESSQIWQDSTVEVLTHLLKEIDSDRKQDLAEKVMEDVQDEVAGTAKSNSNGTGKSGLDRCKSGAGGLRNGYSTETGVADHLCQNISTGHDRGDVELLDDHHADNGNNTNESGGGKNINNLRGSHHASHDGDGGGLLDGANDGDNDNESGGGKSDLRNGQHASHGGGGLLVDGHHNNGDTNISDKGQYASHGGSGGGGGGGLMDGHHNNGGGNESGSSSKGDHHNHHDRQADVSGVSSKQHNSEKDGGSDGPRATKTQKDHCSLSWESSGDSEISSGNVSNLGCNDANTLFDGDNGGSSGLGADSGLRTGQPRMQSPSEAYSPTSSHAESISSEWLAGELEPHSPTSAQKIKKGRHKHHHGKFKVPKPWQRFLSNHKHKADKELMVVCKINEFICSVYLHMSKNIEDASAAGNVVHLNQESLSSHVTKFMVVKYGHRKIVLSRLATLIKSLMKHHDSNPWVSTFTAYCGIFSAFAPDALQFYLQIFAQVHSLGCVHSQELKSKEGRTQHADKIYPVRVPYARRLVRVLCKSMQLSKDRADELGAKLIMGSYKLKIEGKASAGILGRVVQAADVTLVMEIVLAIYFEARERAHALAQQMMARFDKDNSGFLEFDEFCEMMMFMKPNASVNGNGESGATELNPRQLAEMQDLYMQACTGTGDSSEEPFQEEGKSKSAKGFMKSRSDQAGHVSQEGVSAKTFMLNIVADRQLRDAATVANKQAKAQGVITAILVLKKVIRQYLVRKRGGR